MRFLRASLLLSGLMGLMGSVAEASPFLVFGGHSYGLTNVSGDWFSAEAQAVSAGGHLVAINSAAEQNFLTTAFLSSPNDRSIYWIGINDSAVEGLYVWSNGDPVGFTNWHSGEPNDFGGNEDFGAINWKFAEDPIGNAGFQGSWNDVPLNGTGPSGVITDGPYLGIIELPFVVNTPEPTSLAAWSVAFVVGLGVRARRRRRTADQHPSAST